MYIRQSHKRRYDSGCAAMHIISMQHLLEEVIFQVQEIPIDMLPAENGMPIVWLMSEEIDIDQYILFLYTNAHHMQYPRIEFVKSDAW